MGERDFVDFYELLQLSPDADDETVHRVFRHLAKRYHPDTPGGDAQRFNQLVEAHQTLTNPEARAAYDARHQRFWASKWEVATEAADPTRHLDDDGLRSYLLSLFYTQRRSSMRNPGLGGAELARLAGCPHEMIDFHLWYLKEKGWVERLETGLYAITAQGVDAVEVRRANTGVVRLIEARPIRTAAG